MIIEIALLLAGLFGTYHYGRYTERVDLEEERIQCAAEVLDTSRQLKECTDMFEPAATPETDEEMPEPSDLEIEI